MVFKNPLLKEPYKEGHIRMNRKVEFRKANTRNKTELTGFFEKITKNQINEGYFEFFFKKGTKYLIDSVVIIEGSNKKKDNYAKWHSLWASYTLKTPKKFFKY